MLFWLSFVIQTFSLNIFTRVPFSTQNISNKAFRNSHSKRECLGSRVWICFRCLLFLSPIEIRNWSQALLRGWQKGCCLSVLLKFGRKRWEVFSTKGLHRCQEIPRQTLFREIESCILGRKRWSLREEGCEILHNVSSNIRLWAFQGAFAKRADVFFAVCRFFSKAQLCRHFFEGFSDFEMCVWHPTECFDFWSNPSRPSNVSGTVDCTCFNCFDLACCPFLALPALKLPFFQKSCLTHFCAEFSVLRRVSRFRHIVSFLKTTLPFQGLCLGQSTAYVLIWVCSRSLLRRWKHFFLGSVFCWLFDVFLTCLDLPFWGLLGNLVLGLFRLPLFARFARCAAAAHFFWFCPLMLVPAFCHFSGCCCFLLLLFVGLLLVPLFCSFWVCSWSSFLAVSGYVVVSPILLFLGLLLVPRFAVSPCLPRYVFVPSPYFCLLFPFLSVSLFCGVPFRNSHRSLCLHGSTRLLAQRALKSSTF